MAIELSTAGVKLYWCVRAYLPDALEAFTHMPHIKSIPDLNPEPATHETTDLEQEEWKTYISGLKDVGGSITFTANNTKNFISEWNDLMDDHASGVAAKERTFFCVYVPGLSRSFYFDGEPAHLGLSAIDVDSVLEVNPHVTVGGVHGWLPKPHEGVDFAVDVEKATGGYKVNLTPSLTYYIKFGESVAKPAYDSAFTVGTWTSYTSGTLITPDEGDELVVVSVQGGKVTGTYKGVIKE